MSDQTGAVVLLITACTMLAAGLAIGGRVRGALILMAVNVAAVAMIFAGFAYSLEAGMGIRPVAKAVNGVAAFVASLKIAQLAGD